MSHQQVVESSSSSSLSSRPDWDVLLTATAKNQVDRIRFLIQERGISPSHANAVGQSALHVAALWGHVESVQLLLELGAPVNAKNNLSNATPLHMALQSNKTTLEQQEHVVDLLLLYGADTTATDRFGALPLDCLLQRPSIPSGHGLFLKLMPKTPKAISLVENGDLPQLLQEFSEMDPKTVQSTCNQVIRGNNLLTLAIQQLLKKSRPDEDLTDIDNRFQIIQTLISLGATLPLEDSDQDLNFTSPPLFQVLECLQDAYKAPSLNQKIIDILEETCVILQQQQQQQMPLDQDNLQKRYSDLRVHLFHNAARRDDVRLLQFLMFRLDWDVNMVNRQGMTALQFAARSGKVEALKLILPKANVHHCDALGQTALDAAVANQKDDIIEILKPFYSQ